MTESIEENERVVREVEEGNNGCAKEDERCKAASMDGIVVGMLKNGGISITDWLRRIFN